MTLIKWRKQQPDVWDDLFAWGHPLLGLSLFPPVTEKTEKTKPVYIPSLDVVEKKNQIIVKADLPGLQKEDIEVLLDRNRLTIRGERKAEQEEKDGNCRRVERFHGLFERSIQLGSDIILSDVKAKYKNGELELIIPKKEIPQVKTIKIQEG